MDSVVVDFFNKSKIDYFTAYLHLYISYNAWCSKISGLSNSAELLHYMKTSLIIWRDYYDDLLAQDLKPAFLETVKYCCVNSISGPVDESDYGGLIEFWYSVRCKLFHGDFHSSQSFSRSVYLAYSTLFIFMREVIVVELSIFTDEDRTRIKELEAILSVDSSLEYAKTELDYLHTKYLAVRCYND